MRLRFFLPVSILLGVVVAGCGDDTTTDPDSDSSGATSGDGGAGGGGGQGGGGGVGGAACDDSGPDPNNHTAGTCSNLGETSLVAYCNVAIAELKPGVAYDAISCLANVCLRGPGCTTQQYHDQAEQCLVAALAQACADATADATCMDLGALCATAAPDCHALVDGMAHATRADVLACAQADCTAGLAACVLQVLDP